MSFAGRLRTRASQVVDLTSGPFSKFALQSTEITTPAGPQSSGLQLHPPTTRQRRKRSSVKPPGLPSEAAQPGRKRRRGIAAIPENVVPFEPPVLQINEGIPCPESDQKGRQDALLAIADDLCNELALLKFKPPVTNVYNPLEYARENYKKYTEKYGGRKVEAVLIGMNPGPFGMCQTGIPFGDAVLVKEFLQIDGEVQQPAKLHPKRPVAGFNCKRREVSGQRLWGWIRDRFGNPDTFFDRFWIVNYCPLAFMEASGKNRTPNALPAAEREPLMKACDAALKKTLDLLQPKLAIGIGKYARERAEACAPEGTVVGDILHPSPSNPKANAVWVPTIEGQLDELGIQLP